MPSGLELMRSMPDEPERRLPARPIYAPLQHLVSDPSSFHARQLIDAMRRGSTTARHDFLSPESFRHGDSREDIERALAEVPEYTPFNLHKKPNVSVTRLRNGGVDLIMLRTPLNEQDEIGNRFAVGFRVRSLGGEDGRPTAERNIELGSVKIPDEFADMLTLHPSQDGGFTRVLEVSQVAPDVVRYPHEIFVAG